ncbi:MAG: helix-turn-helix transcriptional regulator [Clostridia bacterium]|nr:helix-turn-helix transcriptional regulator [Clostridia bacterium]MBQ2938853.1 helix-turn-helix transcriptional regulator [Clostridia bacterium]
MDTVTAVKNRILQLCGEHNITINKLANLCGLSPSSLKAILYGRSQNPKLLTIKIICDGLDMTLAEFFDTDEFNRLEQEIQ